MQSSCLCLALALAFCPTSRAQDVQTITLENGTNALYRSTVTSAQEPKRMLVQADGSVKAEDAETLIKQIVAADIAAKNTQSADSGVSDRTTMTADRKDAAAIQLKSTAAYILHVVKWKDKTHLKPAHQRWYVFEPGRRDTGSFTFQSKQQEFQRTRIYGKKLLYIIGLYLSEGNLQDPPDSGPPFDVRYEITETRKERQFVKDFMTLLGIVFAAGSREADPQLGFYLVANDELQYSTSDIKITASVKKQKAQASTRVQPAAAWGRPTLLPVALGTAQREPDRTTPARSTGGTEDADYVQLGTQTYDNEGLSHFGLGFAVPLNSYRDISFEETDTVIRPREVKRENVYAMLGIYIPGADTKNTKLRWLPHPIIGMPIKKQPLRQTMAGLAAGFKWVDVFAGYVFNIQQVQSSSSGVATALENRLVRRPVYGITIDVNSAKSAFKKK